MCSRRGRRAPPRFVPEAQEAAALSLLMTPPVAGPVALGEDEATLPPPPSLASNVDKRHMTQVERCSWKVSHCPQPLPFVPLDVAEAQNVTALSLRRWSNKRVRLIGTMEHDAVPWLVSLDPKDEACRVALDLSNLLVWPPLGSPVQVFGTLGVETVTGIPEVRVLFYRPLQSEYLKRFLKAVDAQRPFVPLFVKKLQRAQKRLDSDSSEEADVECALLNPCVLKPPVHKYLKNSHSSQSD